MWVSPGFQHILLQRAGGACDAFNSIRCSSSKDLVRLLALEFEVIDHEQLPAPPPHTLLWQCLCRAHLAVSCSPGRIGTIAELEVIQFHGFDPAAIRSDGITAKEPDQRRPLERTA
jgi:hypothetical protein